VLSDIRRSRFVIADFTGQRSGVYFEAGFAQGLGVPVIRTCARDESHKLHFDVNHYPFIFWTPESLGEFAEHLQRRIEGLIGRGPRWMKAA
jgi:nucleoside 2-deoxyribosyltransferase